MSSRRCPHCGGLVSADAEWCGQCLNRLPAPGTASEPVSPAPEAPGPEPEAAGAPPEPPAAEAQPADPRERDLPPDPPRSPRPRLGTRSAPEAFRMVEGRMVWTCPSCAMENPMEESVCPRCGASFSALFREPEVRERVDPSRAMGFSLLFPGLGHFVAHQGAEGVARGIMFLWAFGSLIGIILVREGGGSTFGNTFVFVYAAASLALYAVTAADARRAAEDRPPLVTVRILFYLAGGLMALTVAALLFGFGGGGG